jgi:hypothetical protein
MKIRIQGNSIRARLNQTEVARMGAGNAVQEITSFSATSKLVYSVKPSSVPKVNATFDGMNLTIELPLEQVVRWSTSDQVGIGMETENGSQTSLRILVEKDFACLHSSGEESADSFPNPRAQ